jgi:hypothetical protein
MARERYATEAPHDRVPIRPRVTAAVDPPAMGDGVPEVVGVIGLGLGYTAANSRRDRTDAVNQRQEDELDTERRG